MCFDYWKVGVKCLDELTTVYEIVHCTFAHTHTHTRTYVYISIYIFDFMYTIVYIFMITSLSDID